MIHLKEQRNRQSSRCGCKASMTIKLKKSFEIFPEEWQVTEFISNHNHDLLPPDQVRFLSSYRNISKEDEKRILLLKEVDLSVKQIMRVMELEKNVKHGDLPFLRKDIHNFFNKIHHDNMNGDANDLLQLYAVAFDTTYKVDLVIEDIGQQQLHHTMLNTYRGSSLRSLSPLEEQVYNIFTTFAFKKFQEEFERATQYKICEENHVEFTVKYYKEQHSQKHKVLCDGDVVSCSCKNFEFCGILCSHVLTIFLHKDCFEIPMSYLPLRWCRDEFQRPVEVNMMFSEGGPIENVENAVDLIKNPPKSNTKGRPKKNRSKGGNESSKRARSCTFCKKSGHDVTTCPKKESYVQPSTTKKRKNEDQAQQNLNPVFYLKSS
ncbi:hypothetical protein P8452_02741 [Trifolium repens]|nr:hypothetical protein P8452_02741 [Trifolium repens]